MKRRPLTRAELARRNPIGRALGACPMPADDQTALNLLAWSALDDVLHGRGSYHHLDALASAANVSLLLCEQGIGADYLQVIVTAQEALMHAHRRAAEGKAIGLDGPGAHALRVALDIHQQQITFAGRAAYAQAVLDANVRARAGHIYTLAPTEAPAHASAAGD